MPSPVQSPTPTPIPVANTIIYTDPDPHAAVGKPEHDSTRDLAPYPIINTVNQ